MQIYKPEQDKEQLKQVKKRNFPDLQQDEDEKKQGPAAAACFMCKYTKFLHDVRCFGVDML